MIFAVRVIMGVIVIVVVHLVVVVRLVLCVVALSDALRVGASLLATHNVRRREQARSPIFPRRLVTGASKPRRFIGQWEQ